MFSCSSIIFLLLSLLVFVESAPPVPPNSLQSSSFQMLPSCMVNYCPQIPNPVCGTNGATYPNLCHLRYVQRCQNKPLLSLAHYGNCGSTTPCSTPCKKIKNPVCGSDRKTYDNTCLLDKEKRCKNRPYLRIVHYGACAPCKVKCPTESKKVCGSDGKTYDSICELNNVQRCENKPFLYLDYIGSCRPCWIAPCLKIDKPVCGSDGNTYDSKCHLEREKSCRTKIYLYLAYEGKCSPPSCRVKCPFTLRMASVCGTDGKTYVSECELNNVKKCENKPDLKVDYPGFCRLTPACMVYCGMKYMPVCGTDKKTYRNTCLLGRTRHCEKKWDLNVDYFGPCHKI